MFELLGFLSVEFMTFGIFSSPMEYQHLQLLQNDVLVKILEKLPGNHDRKSWSLVCKQFYKLEADSKRSIQLLRGEMLKAILNRYQNVDHLDLSLCPRITDRCLQVVSALLGCKLKSINLSRLSRFTCMGLSVLATSCANLVEMDVSCCPIFGDKEAAAVSNAKNLQTLKMVKCQKITDLGLGWIAVGCPKLRHCNFKWCIALTDLGIELLTVKCRDIRFLDLSFLPITNRCIASITQLAFIQTLLIVGCLGISDEGLSLLKNGSQSLQRLDVSKCQNVSCCGIMSLANGSISLSQITLAYCIPIVTDSLLQKFYNFGNLQSIRFDGCEISSSGLGSIGRSFKDLKELSLSKCTGITDEGISLLVAGCQSLKMLDVTCCRDLTDAAIVAVVKSFKGLRCLKMESCFLITEKSITLLGDNCLFLEELDLTDTSISNQGLQSISKCTQLKTLKLGFCQSLSDEGLIYIGAHCSSLEELDLYRSIGVGDDGLTAIAKGCLKLRILNLSYCTHITDQGLSTLGCLKDLFNLEVRGCFQVTSAGVSAVAMGCRHLVELDVKRCNHIDDVGILAVVQYCLNLRQINVSYCPISDVGFLAMVNLSCLQNVKLVHLPKVSQDAFSGFLMSLDSLKKVKLLKMQQTLLPSILIRLVAARGCRIRWVEKPPLE